MRSEVIRAANTGFWERERRRGKEGLGGRVVKRGKMRYSSPSLAQYFDVRRMDFRVGKSRYTMIERRSSRGAFPCL